MQASPGCPAIANIGNIGGNSICPGPVTGVYGEVDLFAAIIQFYDQTRGYKDKIRYKKKPHLI